MDTYWDTYNWGHVHARGECGGAAGGGEVQVGAPSATATVLEWYTYTQFGRLAAKQIRYTRGSGKAEFYVPATYDSYGRLVKL